MQIVTYQADKFFSAQHQERLTELMSAWRVARDCGETLLPEQQSELDNLIETELAATVERAKEILSQKSRTSKSHDRSRKT
jgi:hypothetical protein